MVLSLQLFKSTDGVYIYIYIYIYIKIWGGGLVRGEWEKVHITNIKAWCRSTRIAVTRFLVTSNYTVSAVHRGEGGGYRMLALL